MPQIMGIINATDDSFSDGGDHIHVDKAVDAAWAMLDQGAHIVDIGGESTRPGAKIIEAQCEIDRVLPIIERLKSQNFPATLSIDTRKASVARLAFEQGATLFNDVSAMTYDPDSLNIAKLFLQSGGSVCLMHAKGDPQTMQNQPFYEDVCKEVKAFFKKQMSLLNHHAGLIIDPGIGFGKSLDHNIKLLQNIGFFYDLGAPILIGVSRKSFIGSLTNAKNPKDRLGGSVAAALFALNQGAKILRVHDVYATVQAVKIWTALNRKNHDAP